MGDFWRWGMQNPGRAARHGKSLAAAGALVGGRCAETRSSSLSNRRAEATSRAVNLQVRARDPRFQPLDDATVLIEVQPAPGLGTNSSARPIRAAGRAFIEGTRRLRGGLRAARDTGGYLARASVTNSAGLEVGRAEAGWTTDLAAEEFRSLQPNIGLLEDLARRTGGELVSADNLAAFARRLPAAKPPSWRPGPPPPGTRPAVFGFALACFVAEWGLRRWKGMP